MMSTYTCWRLWAGIYIEEIPSTIPEATESLLDGIYEDPRVIEGLTIEYISLPLEVSNAIGVVLAELHWSDGAKTFDMETIGKAKTVAAQLQKIFKGMGITQRVVIRHHIDLGG